MTLKRHLFKPKWQHKDPEVRRDAVATLDDPELLDSLFTICLKDEDPGVRMAALRRVADLGVLQAALESEQDQEARKLVMARLRQLAASTAGVRPSLESRTAVVRASQDRELLEAVAGQAPEPELRKLALSKIDRQGFLGDRASRDPDPGLRRVAAAAITQRSTLQRVIEETRRTDKELHQELAARLHAELLEGGDPGAVRKEAEALCAALESYALRHTDAPTAVPGEIDARWSALAGKAPADLVERFRNIAARLERPPAPTAPTEPLPAPSSGPPEELAAPIEMSPEPPEESSPEPPVESSPVPGEEISSEPPETTPPATREEASPATPAEEPRPEPAAEGARTGLDEALARAQACIGRYARELEEGALHDALRTRQELVELGRSLKGERSWKAVNRQLSALHGRVRELRDWQHWSNDKIRKRLIKEMEVLPETDLHPDAILDRIKTLQARWKELEESEQIPGDKRYHAAPWMWRKFSAAGHRAFEATRPYLEKRDEIRDRHLEQARDLLDRLRAAIESGAGDWKALNKLLQGARRELRNLDKLPAGARKKMGGRLRSAVAKGNALMKAHYAEVEKAKLRLVREAEQLRHVADRDEAIREAKRLQAEWKAAGSLWRSRENELWASFREPLDPLFGELEADREQAKAAREQWRARQQQLCSEMQALLDSEEHTLLESAGKVQGLKDRWRDIERPDPKMRNRFDEMAARFERLVHSLRRRQADLVRQGWWRKSAILHEVETALLGGTADDGLLDRARAEWPAEKTDEALDRELDTRFRAVLDTREVEAINPGTAARAAELCIQLDFLAGLPSPEQEKEQRMKYQVDRLSRTLAGEGGALSAAQEAGIAEQEWLKLPVLSPRDRARFEKRIRTALDTIYEN